MFLKRDVKLRVANLGAIQSIKIEGFLPVKKWISCRPASVAASSRMYLKPKYFKSLANHMCNGAFGLKMHKNIFQEIENYTLSPLSGHPLTGQNGV